MIQKEYRFQSSNRSDIVWSSFYSSQEKPAGVIHLIHGFGEHSRRFCYLINNLVQNGYAVAADDHIGHGQTGTMNGNLGYPQDDSFKVFINDEKQLYDHAKELFPDIPYFLYGHSWGAALACALESACQMPVNGMILSGMLSDVKGCEAALQDKKFFQICESKPNQLAGMWMNKYFSYFNERVTDSKHPNAWTAVDKKLVAEASADPLCPIFVTMGLMRDFLQTYAYIHSWEWLNRFEKNIPILLMSGDQDPCGNYGAGTEMLYQKFKAHGNPTEMVLYKGYRHAIYAEPDIRQAVAQKILEFLRKYEMHASL